MKSVIQRKTRLSIIFLFVTISNAKRPRMQGGMAGIDRPCTEYAEYRLSPLPPTVRHLNKSDIKDITEAQIKECTDFPNPLSIQDCDLEPAYGVTPCSRFLPVLNDRKRLRPIKVGGKNKNSGKSDDHDSNESEPKVFVYCVYGTLLMSTSIILVLW